MELGEHNIGKEELYLRNNYVLVTKLRLYSLKLENQEMKSTICALNAELEEAKDILAENQPLVSLGAQLSKIKEINKQPSSLDADILCDMAQVFPPEASPEAISLAGGLRVAGILEILGIKNNRIISGILNCIPSPSNLRYALNKSREDTFISIAGFFCNCHCRVSGYKVECAGIVRLVKEIAFLGGDQVQ